MSGMWQRIKGMTAGQSWPSFSFVTNLFTKSNYRDLNQETEHGLEDDPVAILNTNGNNEWRDVTDAGCHRRTFSPVLLDDVENYDRISLSSTNDLVVGGHSDLNGRSQGNSKFSASIFGKDANPNESWNNEHNAFKVYCGNDDIGGKHHDDMKEHSNDNTGKYGNVDINGQSGHGDTNEQNRRGGINGRYGQEGMKGEVDREDINGEYGEDDINEVTPNVFSPYRHENNQRKILSPRQLRSSLQEEVTGVIHVVKQRKYSKLKDDSDEIEELQTESAVPEEIPWHNTFPLPEQKQKSIGRSRSKKVWKRTRKAVRVTWKWLKRSLVSYSSSVNYGIPINVAMYGGSRQRRSYDYR